MTCYCFLRPIRRDLTSSSYTTHHYKLATNVNYMLTNLKFQMGLVMWMMEERFLMMILMRSLQMVSEFISCIW